MIAVVHVTAVSGSAGRVFASLKAAGLAPKAKPAELQVAGQIGGDFTVNLEAADPVALNTRLIEIMRLPGVIMVCPVTRGG